MALDSVDKILDLAIEKEEDAAQFYAELAGKMDRPAMKEVFESFSEEEKRHKTKLMALKDGKLMLSSEKKVLDLKIADYLVETEPSGDMDYREALVLAMKAEKTAFRLYQELASATDDPLCKELFQTLAQEEAKHKLRFEIEYDDYVLSEN